MIETLISSKTRIKLLLKFFLNSNTRAYLRGLATEFGESSNAIRVEINRFEEAGMLSSFVEGNKKMFKANTAHPLFNEIHNILCKYVGLDHIVDAVAERLGEVRKVYLIGEFSKGNNSDVIDLMLVGEVDKSYMYTLVEKIEPIVNRKIRIIVYSEVEESLLDWQKFLPYPLLLWSRD